VTVSYGLMTIIQLNYDDGNAVHVHQW